MVSSEKSRLLLACIMAVAISLALIAPYEIVNSVSANPTDRPDYISKYVFDEDEFTGDAVPVLDNSDMLNKQP
jgi:hypothetical protein